VVVGVVLAAQAAAQHVVAVHKVHEVLLHTAHRRQLCPKRAQRHVVADEEYLLAARGKKTVEEKLVRGRGVGIVIKID